MILSAEIIARVKCAYRFNGCHNVIYSRAIFRAPVDSRWRASHAKSIIAVKDISSLKNDARNTVVKIIFAANISSVFHYERSIYMRGIASRNEPPI